MIGFELDNIVRICEHPQLAETVDCHVTEIRNVVIWGNHSLTQYPDINHSTIMGLPTKDFLQQLLFNGDWNEEEFISSVKRRGASILSVRI